jgi:CubicO group peptidase (beta-lactamase class C family)
VVVGQTPAVEIATSEAAEQGIDPIGLDAFVEALDVDPRVEPHGLIVQRHGRRVVETYWAPHRAGQLRLVYSLSKTFTGTALALALGEGRLSLDDLATDHLPDLMAGADERTRRMRVRHLASMSSGHDREMLLDAFVQDPTDAVRGFFQLPPPHEPGTIFAYNQPPVLALATLLQRLTGQRLVDYLRPRLVEPLGMGDLRWSQYQPGVDLGFSGVYTDLDAVARLGQLHLDDGMWNGERLLPEGWVAQAGAPQIANPDEPNPDWRQGYGFQLWMSQHGYRGDGAYGQYMLVLPEHDTVVALFSCTEDMQVVLDHAWTHLLPALGSDPQPRTTAGSGEGAARLAHRRVPTAADRVADRAGAGPGGSITDGRYAPGAAHGRTHRTLTAVDVTADHLVLHEGESAPLRVPLAADWTDVPGAPIGASATVDPRGRLVVDLVLLATPHRLELVLDPSTRTFDAAWPSVPLFGVGLEPALGGMRPPAA